MEIKNLIDRFFGQCFESNIETYNKFSLQHELGIYLRNHLPDYKVQFERKISFFYPNVKSTKKKIDISIFNADNSERYAVSLQYPRNGQYPESMYSFVKDIKFMEELKELGFKNTFCVVLVDDSLFYDGDSSHGIYQYFRKNQQLHGEIFKPTGKDKGIESFVINGTYSIGWKNTSENRKYYCIKI